jgi:transposase InsO family protein
MNTVAPCWTPLFSPRERISQVPVDQIFDVVKYLLFRWGLIGSFRADNGAPFGDPSRRALSALNLCLRGFGIQVKVNPPRRPQKNAKVERNQGTTSRWADVSTCKDYLDFQNKLNQAVMHQREIFPTRVCKGKTRAECFPKLFSNPKKFDPNAFYPHFIYEHLAKGSWQRKVSKDGTTRLFSENYQIGRKHRLKTVTASFDAQQQAWLFKDRYDTILKTCPATNLSETHIRNFSLCQ